MTHVQDLRKEMLDEFSNQVLTGALRVAHDSENPIRLNLFAAAIRELFTHTLHNLAPDSRVRACSWYRQNENTAGPTRRQRAKYATQGGLSDEFVAELGVDVADLHDQAMAAVDDLNRFTHVRPNVIIVEQDAIDDFVKSALMALHSLLLSFRRCREQMLQALYDHIDEQTVSAFITETIGEIDELAPHHLIDEIYIDDLEVVDISESHVEFSVTGTLGIELQWGSRSDFARDDGVVNRVSFPFHVSMHSPVDDIVAFSDVRRTIDMSSWYGA